MAPACATHSRKMLTVVIHGVTNTGFAGSVLFYLLYPKTCSVLQVSKSKDD